MFLFVRVFSSYTFVSSLYRLNIQSFAYCILCLSLVSHVVFHDVSLYMFVCFCDILHIGFYLQ